MNGKPTKDVNSYGLSIKLHNALCIDLINYYVPLQQVSVRLTSRAKVSKRHEHVDGSRARSNFVEPGKRTIANGTAQTPNTKTVDIASFVI